MLSTLAHADDVIYAIDYQNERITRWSMNQGAFLDPIATGPSPVDLEYVPQLDSLLVAYLDGTITQVALGNAMLEESAFAEGAHRRLVAAGDYVLAHGSRGYMVFNLNGEEISNQNTLGSGHHLMWHEPTQRVIFQTAWGVDAMHLDPSGQLHDVSVSANGDRLGSLGRLYPSPDGSLLVSAAGELLEADSLDYRASIPFESVSVYQPISDIIWHDDDSVLVVKQASGQSIVEHWALDGHKMAQTEFPGGARGLIDLDGTVLVATSQNGTIGYQTVEVGRDLDGDGVASPHDDFPHDIAASLDSDLDGFPDAWNEGYDSGDSQLGLVLDAFPHDAACQIAQHGIGGQCDVSIGIGIYQPTKLVGDNEGVVFTLAPDESRIYRWSAVDNRFLNPIVIGESALDLTYSANQHSLFVGYASGLITRIDLSETVPREQNFASTAGRLTTVVAVNELLLAEDVLDRGSTYLFSDTGERVERIPRVFGADDLAWDSFGGQFVSLAGALRSVSLDSSSLMFGDPTHASLDHRLDYRWLRLSHEAAYVLLNTGDYFSGDSLQLQGSLAHELVDAAGLADGSMVTIQGSSNGLLLEHYQSDFQLYNKQEYAGEPIAVVTAGNHVVVATRENETVVYHEFVPTHDADGDGIATLTDSFPFDPAASVDSDADGYPDDWNVGYTSDDSTTGLMLDSFPDDAACQVAAHARADDPASCDLRHGVPDYEPDRVVRDEDGHFYFLSDQNDRVYRWSATDDYHLTSIAIGIGGFVNQLHDLGATEIAVDPLADKLYIGYATGKVTVVDLDDAAHQERLFGEVERAIQHVKIVGNWIAIATEDQLVVFDQAGGLVDSIYIHSLNATDVAWDPNQSRLHIVGFGESTWVSIDQTTGAISHLFESPTYEERGVHGPISISADGTLTALGNGEIIEADEQSLRFRLQHEFAASFWMDNGELLTVRNKGDDTLLEHWTRRLDLFNHQQYPNAPIDVAQVGDAYYVVTSGSPHGPNVVSYVPTDDFDGDGIANAADDFSQDPAASVDSDNDGHPDTWNDGYSGDDSVLGLTLDAFPMDSACHSLQQATSGDPAVCDISAQVPVFQPADVVMTDASMVGFVGPDNNRIYRWSVEQERFINPLIASPLGAVHLVRSDPALDRLYVASGSVITYFQTDSGEAEYFARVPGGVEDFVIADEFIFVSIRSLRDTHVYVFDTDGVQVDRSSYLDANAGLSWDGNFRRIYFSRGYSQSPEYAFLTESGTLSRSFRADSAGEAASPRQEHLVSSSGKWLIRNGRYRYTSQPFRAERRLPHEFSAVAWGPENTLVTLRERGANTLLEQWDERLTHMRSETLPGAPLDLVSLGDRIVASTVLGLRPFFHTYEVVIDEDGDGIAAWDDAFPLDPAASVDRDRDGAPDHWNDGFTAEDSTTGLTLDVFPDDAACQLETDAVVSSPDVCDLTFEFFDSTPDSVWADDEGIVYMHTRGGDRVYRWSSQQMTYLNPIIVQSETEQVAFSNVSNVLIALGSDGMITKYDVIVEPPIESYVGGTREPATRILAVGNDVWAYDSSANGTVTSMTLDGTYKSESSHVGTNPTLAYNEASSQLYFTSDDTRLGRRPYDAATGSFRRGGLTNRTFDLFAERRLFVSDDARFVLLSDRQVFDADRLTARQTLSIAAPILDAEWLANGTVAIISADAEGTRVDHWHRSFTARRSMTLAGIPVGLVEVSERLIAITRRERELLFHAFDPLLGPGIRYNDLLPEDVDADGTISPIDALVLINALPGIHQVIDASMYYDVNADTHISPLDALKVISKLPVTSGGSAATSSSDATNVEYAFASFVDDSDEEESVAGQRHFGYCLDLHAQFV